jgi:uncharacterized protein YcfL
MKTQEIAPALSTEFFKKLLNSKCSIVELDLSLYWYEEKKLTPPDLNSLERLALNLHKNRSVRKIDLSNVLDSKAFQDA